MIKTSKHNIKNITNRNKLDIIDQLFIDYKSCLEYYMKLILTEKLVDKFKNMFNVKHVRIVQYNDRLYLIINNNNMLYNNHVYKNSTYTPNQFSYLDEKVVASGNNELELVDNAYEYLKISNMDIVEYYEYCTGQQLNLDNLNNMHNINETLHNVKKIIKKHGNEHI